MYDPTRKASETFRHATKHIADQSVYPLKDYVSDIPSSKSWSTNKKLAVGTGLAAAGTLAAYGGYKAWKARKKDKNKNESLLSAIDEINDLALAEGYEFASTDELFTALGAVSNFDIELAEDLFELINDVDSQLDEAKKSKKDTDERDRPLKTFAYGGTGGDTEAGGLLGGFGHALGAGLGTAAAAGLASEKGRKKLSRLFGATRPTDKDINKMMNKVKAGGLNANQRDKLEKMLISVSSRKPAGRNIAAALGGGAALGAGAMYAYNRWQQKRKATRHLKPHKL